MSRIAAEPVTQVHHRGGAVGREPAGRVDSRHRVRENLARRGRRLDAGIPGLQRRTGPSQYPGHPDPVAGPGFGARHPARRMAQHGDRDDPLRTGAEVAADDLGAHAGRRSANATHHLDQPLFARSGWNDDGGEHCGRRGCCRRHVRKRAGRGAPADLLEREPAKPEMHVLDAGVHADHRRADTARYSRQRRRRFLPWRRRVRARWHECGRTPRHRRAGPRSPALHCDRGPVLQRHTVLGAGRSSRVGARRTGPGLPQPRQTSCNPVTTSIGRIARAVARRAA